jgi:IS5 family transposase
LANELICRKKQTKEPKDPDEPGGPPHPGGTHPEQGSKTAKPTNKGKLLLDATCAPADIRYPTDLSLLNEAREKTEKIIDTLYHTGNNEDDCSCRAATGTVTLAGITTLLS